MSAAIPSYASSSSRIPGTGHLHLSSSSSSSSSSRFTTLLASYPLKLLTPTPLPSQPSNVGAVYTLAYGGGLVGGDVISLSVIVDQGCGLVILTQGSTKVFKRRPGLRPLSHSCSFKGIISKDKDGDKLVTKQRMSITIKTNSFVLLLPDSISPFALSNYAQAQRFLLPDDGTGSVLILDWVNSGRGQRSLQQIERGKEELEIWSMDKYTSTNEVYLGDKLIMRDRMVLDNFPTDNNNNNNNKEEGLSRIARQLAPYNIYATLLIYGPHLFPLLNYLKGLSHKTRQFQLSSPPGLLWSFSEIDQDKGGILRVAAVQVEDARIWLRAVMKEGKVNELVGDGLWSRLI